MTLLDGGEKRCPACRSRIRAGARPADLENAGIAARPLHLVERELEARIEAETAAGFRQRRRAAKVARRIAALPPTLFQGGPVGAGGAEAWTPQPAAAPASFIDLPDSAVHEVTSTNVAADEPAEVVEVVEVVIPEPVVEVVTPEPVVEAGEVVEVVEAGDVVEVVEAVEPEPEPVAVMESEPEPVEESAPIAAANWQRPSSGTWTEHVFKSPQRVRRPDAVTWPRGWKREPTSIDYADESA